ncbi:hypothetical protein RFI_06027, partial [Reticulomyxa filosa]
MVYLYVYKIMSPPPPTSNLQKKKKKQWKEASKNPEYLGDPQLDYNVKYRIIGIKCLWIGLFDLVFLSVGVLSVVIMPFRIFAFKRMFVVHWEAYKQDDYGDLRLALVWNMLFACLDWMFIALSLPLLVMFTRYYHVWKKLKTASAANMTEQEANQRFGTHYKDLKYDTTLRLEIVGNVIPGLYDWLILLCGLASVVVMPFRAMAFVRCFSVHWKAYKEDHYDDLRAALVMNLCFAICDWVFIFCMLPMLFMFTRYYHIAQLIRQRIAAGDSQEKKEERYGSYGDDLKYDSLLRWQLLWNWFPGLVDWFVLLFGLLAIVIMPLRLFAFVRSIYVHWDDYKKDEYSTLRVALLMNLWFAICEWLFLLCAIPLLLMWTRYYHMVKQVKEALNDHNEGQVNKYGDYEKDLQYNTHVRLALLSNIFVGLLDWLVLLLAILSVAVMPLRIIALIRSVGVHWHNYTQDQYDDLRVAFATNLLFSLYEWVFAIFAFPLLVMFTRYYHMWKQVQASLNEEGSEDVRRARYGRFALDLQYNIALRKQLVANIGSGLCDWFVLICGVAAFIIMPLRFAAFARCIRIHWDAYKNDNYDPLRKALVINLCVAFIEWWFLLFAIPLLFLFTRYYHIFHKIKEAFHASADTVNSLRLIILSNFFPGLRDYFVLLWGLLAVAVMPLRAVAFVRSLYVHWDDYKKDQYGALRSAMLTNLWFAICEW